MSLVVLVYLRITRDGPLSRLFFSQVTLYSSLKSIIFRFPPVLLSKCLCGVLPLRFSYKGTNGASGFVPSRGTVLVA